MEQTLAMAPSVTIQFVIVAIVAVALLVGIFLGFIYLFSKIVGQPFSTSGSNIDVKIIFLALIAAFFSIMAIMVIVTDDDNVNKALAWAVLVGSLAAIGIKVKKPKIISSHGSDVSSPKATDSSEND